MKKAVLLAAALVGLSLARAEGEGYQYLYWQVQADNVASRVADYNMAYLYAINGEGVRTAVGVTDWAQTQTSDARTDSAIVGTADLSSYAGCDFLIELSYWEEGKGDKIVGTSDRTSYADLGSYMATFKYADLPISGILWAPAIGVPEPTSGLLLLLGFAGLALRRKYV